MVGKRISKRFINDVYAQKNTDLHLRDKFTPNPSSGLLFQVSANQYIKWGNTKTKQIRYYLPYYLFCDKCKSHWNKLYGLLKNRSHAAHWREWRKFPFHMSLKKIWMKLWYLTKRIQNLRKKNFLTSRKKLFFRNLKPRKV